MAVLAGLSLGVLGMLWAFYERRERRGGTAARPSAHHCVRCDAVYGAPRAGADTPCPRCGHLNRALRF